MKAISHCQRGFLSLYGVSLRGAEHEVGAEGVAGVQEARGKGGGAKEIQLLLRGNLVNLQPPPLSREITQLLFGPATF